MSNDVRCGHEGLPGDPQPNAAARPIRHEPNPGPFA